MSLSGPSHAAFAEQAWADRELNPQRARQWVHRLPPCPQQDVLLAYLDWRTGSYDAAFARIDAALSALSMPDVWRSRALNTCAGLLMTRLDVGAAHDLYTEQLAVAQECGDKLELAHAKHDLALTLLDLDPPGVLPLLQEALTLFEGCGASELAGVAHLNLGEYHQHGGSLDQALHHYQRAAAHGEAKLGESGYSVLLLLALAKRTVLHVQQGHLSQAEQDLARMNDIPQSQDIEAEVERARASVLVVQEVSRVRWAQQHGRTPRISEAMLTDDPATLALAMIGQANARQIRRLAELEMSLAQAEAQHAEAQRRSITDTLTGLHNRQHLMVEGQRIVAGSTAFAPAQAAMIDVDRFKRINDTHGHAAGDAVLLEIATLLSRYAQPGDLLARYGGEEFVLIRPAGRPNLASALDAFRLAVQDNVWISRPVTVSIGLTLVNDEQLNDALDRADQLMYVAKRAGGNRLRHDLSRETAPASVAPSRCADCTNSE